MKTTDTVLLVTRDSDLKSSLTEALSARAMTVEPAFTAEQLRVSAERDWQAGGCCIVVDVTSVGSNADSDIADLTGHTKSTPTIALIQVADVRFAAVLMRAGAYDVVVKGDIDHLLNSISSSLNPDGLALRRRRAAIRHIVSRLSESEQEVLRLTIEGFTNKQIANRLDLSQRTVNFRRAKLVEKFGASTRSELIRLAIESGLFDGDVSTF